MLTGVASPGELVCAAAALRPSYIAEDLESGLLAPHPPVQEAGRRLDVRWLDGAARPGVARGGDGTRIDALRALCAGVWSQGEGAADAEQRGCGGRRAPDR